MNLCIRCQKKANNTIDRAYFCTNCFILVIKQRFRKELLGKLGKKIQLIQNKNSSSKLLKFLASEIANKMDAKIVSYKSKVVLSPKTADDYADEFLQSIKVAKPKIPTRILSPLLFLRESECKNACRILKIKTNIKSHKNSDEIEAKFPGSVRRLSIALSEI